jgi:AcrR family transcriptional regulator
MAEPALASDGRVIGARAQRTRRKLLDATAELLEARGAFGLRVVDITRRVGLSPATFYQYFPDVEAAILVLADEASDDAHFLSALLEPSWHEAGGEARAFEFVRAFVDYWDRHRAVLRVRDLRAEEGDKRFWAARLDGYSAIVPGLTTMIEKGQAAGRVSAELNAYAAASALAAMMERLATYQQEFGRRGVTTDAMTHTLAAIVFQTVTGFTS